MWDPVSVFVCMYVLNVGLPDARLRVNDIISIEVPNKEITTPI